MQGLCLREVTAVGEDILVVHNPNAQIVRLHALLEKRGREAKMLVGAAWCGHVLQWL